MESLKSIFFAFYSILHFILEKYKLNGNKCAVMLKHSEKSNHRYNKRNVNNNETFFSFCCLGIFNIQTMHSADEVWAVPNLTAGGSVLCIAVGDGRLTIGGKILVSIDFDAEGCH